MNLLFVVDVSGSMNEMGKIHLQRNLCRFAAQLKLIDWDKYANLRINFYQWAQDISEITIQNDGDIPALNAGGSSSLNVLSNFFSQIPNVTEKPNVLLLSDGNFDYNEYSSFLNWKQEHNKIIIHTVAVGADADLLRLKKISTNNSVHLSENIASAIDSIIFDSDEPFAAPVSTAQIMHSALVESEEPEEDWDA